MKPLLLILCFLGVVHAAQACTGNHPDSLLMVTGSGQISYTFTFKNEKQLARERPNPLLLMLQKKQRLNKKITAAVLAFPFPFGIVGLHRIYMGTKPYVPVVYIATIGGVFGILPFIDFCVLMFDKDFQRYENNGKVFMWIKTD